MPDVLHVGCGAYASERLPPVFREPGWREIRLDIDPGVGPDLVASITDMAVVPGGSVDAVYSSHNIEHLYPHEVPVALREMHRVLKPSGFLFVTLPDLQEVGRRVAEDGLDTPLYMSPMGPIAPLDILFGHRPSIAAGNVYMAHRTGFTQTTLGRSLIEAGFAAVVVQRNEPAFSLAAVAFMTPPGHKELTQTRIMLPAEGPLVLITPGPASPSSAAPEQILAEAISHHRNGDAAEAETLYRVVLASAPGTALASYNLGVLYLNQGRFDAAVEACRAAIAVQPGYVEAHINLGTALLALRHPEEAVECYKRAITISPDNAMAIGNLGKALQDMGRLDDAIAAYRVALGHQPANATVTANLGSALLSRQARADSATVSRRAIALQADNAMAHANLGTALIHLGQHDAALAACRQAITLQLPRDATVLASLGGAMVDLGELNEAERLCRDAVALDPALPNGFFNLSHVLKAMNRLDEAAGTVRRAIALRPESAEYRFHLAHILLLQGQFEEGWAEYEWRWQLPDFAWLSAIHRAFPQPQWTGQALHGKTILIHTEQGLGDIVMFARYLPLVVRLAGHVILACTLAVRRLLEPMEGITLVSIDQVPLPPFDFYCPLLSLPRAFGTRLATIPADLPYLRVEPAGRRRWAERIGGDGLRVGIVWAGNPVTKGDRLRSPGLHAVAPLLSVPGVDVTVLQVGAGRKDCDAGQLPPHIGDLGKEVTDLADTAAIMSNLDLVISSCTATLHLAGALGVPTLALIPFAPYFPWMLEAATTRWYPGMRLYRQEQPGQDWSGVVSRMARDLGIMARAWNAPERFVRQEEMA